jgi:DNA polymerase III subunit gamma/tau
VSLALYRRYRPETFAEVIGQEHVTEPLQQAIRNDRVHHAYLFSGPRGCGKTTSARLLARCLNCEKGPTPEPCGECQSCRDLSRGGAGSIDVVEIDAASHGGVDDARDLRERAFFAPAVSRYKIYIIDEAHMVTMAGFNALLKVVEEPPPHLKFVFATTEPDKVIPTIRSRTHHYPFRLVPPRVMRDYLGRLCQLEGVAVEPAVLPLVVRAGAGSVRDALSVLDQLIAGAGESGVTYALATSLLGFTDAQLLDDVVDAFAAGDGAGVFRVVERVIEGGHDPRRFAQDLLERLRDLVILSAVPDAESSGLIEAPADQLERMRQQAENLGSAELTRAADIVNAGLTEMRGATAPRLQLKLICARILLPGADHDQSGFHARIDRLERLLSVGAAPIQPASPESEKTGAGEVPDRRVSPHRTVETGLGWDSSEARTDAAAPAGLDLAGVRRIWPDILEVVKAKRRFTWLMLLDHVQVVGLADGVLTVAFANEGQRKNFATGGSDEILREAVYEVLGADWRIEAVLDPGRATQTGSEPSRPASGPGGLGRPSQPGMERSARNQAGRSRAATDSSGGVAEGTPAGDRGTGDREGAAGGERGTGDRGGAAAGDHGTGDRGGAPAGERVGAAGGERGTGDRGGAGDAAGAKQRSRGRESRPTRRSGDQVTPSPRATDSRGSGATHQASTPAPEGELSRSGPTVVGEVPPVPQQRVDGAPEAGPDPTGGGARPLGGPTDTGDTAVPPRRAVQNQNSTPTGGAVDDPDAHAHPDDDDLDDGGLAGAELLVKELGATLIDEIDRQD